MGHDLQVYLNWYEYPVTTTYVLGVVIARLPLIHSRVRKYCASYLNCKLASVKIPGMECVYINVLCEGITWLMGQYPNDQSISL